MAVFDADAPPALAFVRSLGRHGVPVHVYSTDRFAVSGLSRYATERRVAPRLDDASEFLPWLREQLRGGAIELVAPTSDLVAFYLASLDGELSPRLRAVLPRPERMLDALLKHRFHARCAELGFETPQTFCPTSLQEAAALAPALRWPVVLKPRSHVGVGLARGVVVRDEAELLAHFRPYPIASGNAAVAERCPGLQWPMVQQYVPGALQHLYSVSGVLGDGGEVVACAASHKSTQWPPNLGVGTMFAPHLGADVIELGVRLVRQVLGRGIFELELIYDASRGAYVAIDLNPRAFGQINLDIARRLDLPALWYRLAMGERPGPVADADSEVRWVHSIPFHVGQLIGVMRGPGRLSRLADYVGALSHRRVDVVHDTRDPLPSLAFTAKMFRHPGGLVRPFFSSKL